MYYSNVGNTFNYILRIIYIISCNEII